MASPAAAARVRRRAAAPVKKLSATKNMVVNADFLKAMSKFQLSPFSAITQAVENARECGGRFNASTLRIDGPRRVSGEWDVVDEEMEWIIISDDGEGCYDLLGALNLGHANSESNDAASANNDSVKLGNFGVGLKNGASL